MGPLSSLHSSGRFLRSLNPFAPSAFLRSRAPLHSDLRISLALGASNWRRRSGRSRVADNAPIAGCLPRDAAGFLAYDDGDISSRFDKGVKLLKRPAQTLSYANWTAKALSKTKDLCPSARYGTILEEFLRDRQAYRLSHTKARSPSRTDYQVLH